MASFTLGQDELLVLAVDRTRYIKILFALRPHAPIELWTGPFNSFKSSKIQSLIPYSANSSALVQYICLGPSTSLT